MNDLLTVLVVGSFLAREQAAGTTPTPTATTSAKPSAAPANSPSPAVELPATETGFNTDYNGAPAGRPR
jgi:hypothetical protein